MKFNDYDYNLENENPNQIKHEWVVFKTGTDVEVRFMDSVQAYKYYNKMVDKENGWAILSHTYYPHLQ